MRFQFCRDTGGIYFSDKHCEYEITSFFVTKKLLWGPTNTFTSDLIGRVQRDLQFSDNGESRNCTMRSVRGTTAWDLAITAWDLRVTAWDLGITAWDLEVTAWDLGITAWDLGITAWDLGITAWDLEVTAWDLGITAWDLGSKL
ncbi:hypothetical protein FHG87_002674 [Trinorchestia longiramus]|nr:hypothetical protein FHG87_002674 [Trinorchestia longiramus]